MASPVPTSAPSTYGLKQYYPMSSQTNQMASNYQSTAPMSSNQLNAYGSQLYSSTPNSTRVVNTNPLTGAFPQNNPQPQPGPAPQPQQDSGPSQEQLLNDIFGPTDNYLNEYASNIQSQQPLAEQNINTNYGISKESLVNQNTSGLNQLGQMSTEAGQTKESADSNAVRLFNELKRGGIQRFGGASSAGEAYNTLTGNELQRNLGTIQKTWSGTVEKINSYKVDLENKFSTALQTLDQQKNEALQNAQQFFQDKMLEVTRMKAENQSAKATAQLGLLQDLRNKVYAINMQELQYKQSLAANKQASEASVSQYAQQMLDNITGGDKSLQAGLMGMQGATNTNLTMGANQQAQGSQQVGQIAQTPQTKKNWWEA